MNIHHVKFVIIEVLMGTNTLCSCKLSCIRYFHYYSGWVGGWVGGGWVFRKIKNKNHLSPAEAEIGAELGKKGLSVLSGLTRFIQRFKK